MKISKIFKIFFENEKASGLILIACTLFSLAIANSIFGHTYVQFWHTIILNHSLHFWVNEALMTLFFLLIGLELKRELLLGELSEKANAILPLIAAVGGMIVPFLVYFLINHNTAFASGAGIPMATDIAFALAILALLGNKIPYALKIFLTALAIIDDMGAVIVIALFYTKSILWLNLLAVLAIFAILLALNKYKIQSLFWYILGGIAMWYFMYKFGVHPTVAGVLLAFAMPLKTNNGSTSSAMLLQTKLLLPVGFFILPLFALSNTGLVLEGSLAHVLTTTCSAGIILGLVLGKPVGIICSTYLAVKLGLYAKLPSGLNWRHIIGVGLLGGIGFTMSIFVALLAFDSAQIIEQAKLAILFASCISATLGYLFLRLVVK